MPVWVCNSPSTACEPGHRRARGAASIHLQPPLLTPFPTGHGPLETLVYWEVGKNGWFGSNLAGDQGPMNGDFLCPTGLCSQLRRGGVFPAPGCCGAASSTSGVCGQVVWPKWALQSQHGAGIQKSQRGRPFPRLVFPMGDPAGEGQLSIISCVSIFQGWCKRGGGCCCCCCRTSCWARGLLDGYTSKDTHSSAASCPTNLQLGSGRKMSYRWESAGR